jgi:hypothetical protein
LFLGNSIIYAGHYISYTEAYLKVRYPDRNWKFINIGLPSETASIEVDWKNDDGSVNNCSNHNSLYTGNVAWPDNEWLMPIPQSQIELNVDNNWVQNEGY